MSLQVNYPKRVYSVLDTENFRKGIIEIKVRLPRREDNQILNFEFGPCYNISNRVRNAVMIYIEEDQGHDSDYSSETTNLANIPYLLNLDTLIKYSEASEIDYSRGLLFVYICHDRTKDRSEDDVKKCFEHVLTPLAIEQMLEATCHNMKLAENLDSKDIPEELLMPKKYGVGVIRPV